MSKISRKLREIKKRSRAPKVYTELSIPAAAESTVYTVKDIKHERGRGSPYVVVEVNGKEANIIAVEGMAVNDSYPIGDNITEISTGTVTKLKNIPEGTAISSVEYEYNDGGQIALTAGTFCTVVNHRRESGQTVVKMPSGHKRVLSSEVRAMVGVCASAGVTDKPVLKAATKRHLCRSKGQYFPRVRGVAMNPVDHAHGGGNKQHIGFPCTIARGAPYAQQVGLIAARSTGRRTGAKKNK